uniref:SFRICE_006088 n=1 Tax=Spodoptera frugiperda TaxID=7108 RepID=A0A2H1V1H0_SPOFR
MINDRIAEGCTIYVYSYTDVKAGFTSERFLVGTLHIVSLDKCAALDPYVASRYDIGMMCAVGDGVDACQVT